MACTRCQQLQADVELITSICTPLEIKLFIPSPAWIFPAQLQCADIMIVADVSQDVYLQDAEFMEQKKSERAGRGANAWQPKARQQELDEEDRFQVGHCSCLPLAVDSYAAHSGPIRRQTQMMKDTLMTCRCLHFLAV